MEGSMGGGLAKMVKFTGSNRIMTMSKLRNLVYQKTLAVGSKRSQSAHTQTQVEKFGVLRDCCNGEARVLLNDHFQARIDRNRELYEAVEAENLQLETHTRAAWQRAYDAYTVSRAGGQGADPGTSAGAGGTGSSASRNPWSGGCWCPATAAATRPSGRSRPSGPAPASTPGSPCPTKETTSRRFHHSDGRLRTT
jgi:hypothetical protein